MGPSRDCAVADSRVLSWHALPGSIGIGRYCREYRLRLRRDRLSLLLLRSYQVRKPSVGYDWSPNSRSALHTGGE